MATAVAVKSAVGNWSKMFPMDLGTELYSLVFIKKLFAVAVSYVLYFRNLFPDSAFFDKQLEGVNLKILREDSSLPGSSKIVYWLRGCFDAIDRQYLKTAMVTLYSIPNGENETDLKEYDIIESYCFRMTYNQTGLSLNISTESNRSTDACLISGCTQEDVKSATLNLLKTIQTAGKKLKSLPSKFMITMRLQYYEEVTPENYVPPGFKHAPEVVFTFDEDPVNVRLGSVKTINSQIKQFEGDELSSSLQKQTLQSEDSESGMYEARCPCGVNKDDGVMILCDGCGTWQHAVCFRIVEESDVPVSHVCELCAETKPELLEKGGITDTTLQSMNVESRKTACLLRRALLFCMNVDSVSPASIAKNLEVEYTVARGIFNRLIKEQVLKETGHKRGEKLVQKEYLETVFYPKIFGNVTQIEPTKDKASPQTSQISKAGTFRRTPRKRTQETDYNSVYRLDESDLIPVSQDSIISPVPTKRKRRSGIANTPISIFR